MLGCILNENVYMERIVNGKLEDEKYASQKMNNMSTLLDFQDMVYSLNLKGVSYQMIHEYRGIDIWKRQGFTT